MTNIDSVNVYISNINNYINSFDMTIDKEASIKLNSHLYNRLWEIENLLNLQPLMKPVGLCYLLRKTNKNAELNKIVVLASSVQIPLKGENITNEILDMFFNNISGAIQNSTCKKDELLSSMLKLIKHIGATDIIVPLKYANIFKNLDIINDDTKLYSNVSKMDNLNIYVGDNVNKIILLAISRRQAGFAFCPFVILKYNDSTNFCIFRHGIGHDKHSKNYIRTLSIE